MLLAVLSAIIENETVRCGPTSILSGECMQRTSDGDALSIIIASVHQGLDACIERDCR